MQALTIRHRRQVFALRARMISELRILWEYWDPEDDTTWPRFAMPATLLIQRHSQEAADLGARYYRDMRAKILGRAPSHPTLPDPIPAEKIQASLSATGLAGTYIGVRMGRSMTQAKSVAFRRVSYAAGRHVANGARLAVTAAVSEDASARGWVRRVAGTCSWCEEHAGEVPSGEDFHGHDGCMCVAEPDFSKTLETKAELPKFREQVAFLKTDESLQAAYDAYTGHDYTTINAALRSGASMDAELSEVVSGLDRLIAHRALEHDTRLLRSGGPDIEFALGDEFVDDAFVSTTYELDLETGGSTDPVFDIIARKGTHYAYGTFGERELILPRGTKFRVIGVVQEKRRVRYLVEVVK